MGLVRLEPLVSLSASPICVGAEEVTMVREYLTTVPPWKFTSVYLCLTTGHPEW